MDFFHTPLCPSDVQQFGLLELELYTGLFLAYKSNHYGPSHRKFKSHNAEYVGGPEV